MQVLLFAISLKRKIKSKPLQISLWVSKRFLGSSSPSFKWGFRTSRYLEKHLFPGHPGRDFAEGSSLLSMWIHNALEEGSWGFQWQPKQLITLWKSNCLIWSDCSEHRSWFPAASLLARDISGAQDRINALLVGLWWITHRGRFPLSPANSAKMCMYLLLKKNIPPNGQKV